MNTTRLYYLQEQYANIIHVHINLLTSLCTETISGPYPDVSSGRTCT